MFASDFSPSCFEKPSLYLLSLLLDPQGFSSGNLIPSDFGPLRFDKMDLLQERGRIPQLALDFTHGDGSFLATYFGHVSPFKLHFAELALGGNVERYVFSKGADVLIPMQTARPVSALPQGLDWSILAGSISLWRACVGLPGACEESLGKYFSKMKSVSRYQWINDSYERQGDDILETWSTCIACDDIGDVKISVLFVNGLISGVSS
ncbi:hypothetical protein [Desulfovibrio sp. JC010]|uniref:hypothetical protein n=1 Tax=Desulfovibrio sp. JC010 TaxID=2593641 RepID=UPI0013D62491|nr:hypothetical protein [Desulfovibrio sp. JC010]NDV25670.1 hypothetical protein [Desulfovibrio sp. JC010]